jgi:hypothetical protein
MAMNYKVVKDNFGYNVLETGTDQIMKVCESQEEAKKLMKHLNLGGGFDGFTPSFIVSKVHPALNKNSKNM